MAKKQSKHKRRKKEEHPCIFILEGEIRHYDEGSMLQLHTLITTEEWEIIVDETVKYKVFLECLKDTGCPLLGEPWEKEDDWFRLQLDVAVSRMRNLDPFLVASHNQKALTVAFTEKMTRNAGEVQDLVTQMRDEKKAMAMKQFGSDGSDNDIVSVSDI